MLIGLSIRNYLVMSKLDVELATGFCALTGETGVGKSVIVSALQTALGARTEPNHIAPGADSATLTACFVPNRSNHPVFTLLQQRGLEANDTQLTLRRVIYKHRRSRAFINDLPVPVATLRTVGNLLVDFQNQRASHELLTSHGQTALLDAFANATQHRMTCQTLWDVWQEQHQKLQTMLAQHDEIVSDIELQRNALAELDALDPLRGEATHLADQRRILMRASEARQTLTHAQYRLEGHHNDSETGAIAALAQAAALLHRLNHTTPQITQVADALARAMAEADDAARSLRAACDSIELTPQRLETIEERLFAITAIARKHRADPDALDDVRTRLNNALTGIDRSEKDLDLMHTTVARAQKNFDHAVAALSEKRRNGAKKLTLAVMRELPPMRMQTARFKVSLLQRDQPGPDGAEHVVFDVSTNPDTPFGALAKIASGGEFSRIALALRLCAPSQNVSTLIFDEADAGIGGATAAAVGERLARLAKDKQVLAVTHSPQVAAASSAQWRIHKEQHNGRTVAGMTRLTGDSRTEEIARMISGTQVTEQARAAAERLLTDA